jgi:hypothetical protein
LARHGKEFLEEDMQSSDKDNLPLIRTLNASVPQWKRGQGGELVTPKTEQAGSALRQQGSMRCSSGSSAMPPNRRQQAGLDEQRFEKASTHWMRHTFVRQALVDGVPIEVASELAGHASIDTTSIYSTQELARKIKAVRGGDEAFDLYRMRAAIDRVLDEPRWMQSVQVLAEGGTGCAIFRSPGQCAATGEGD